MASPTIIANATEETKEQVRMVCFEKRVSARKWAGDVLAIQARDQALAIIRSKTKSGARMPKKKGTK